MGDRPVTALWGIGARTASRLADSGIHTVVELARSDHRQLAQQFGPTIGPYLKMLGLGGDDSPVVDEPHVPRSRSREVTFEHDITSPTEIDEHVARLGAEVTESVVAEGRRVTHVAVKVRTATFFTRTKISKLPQPTTDPAEVARPRSSCSNDSRSPDRCGSSAFAWCSNSRPDDACCGASWLAGYAPRRMATSGSNGDQAPHAEGADRRGRDADQPTEIPPTGWKDVLTRVRAEAKDDGVTLMAAGVAFYALLALVPGLVALISIYGLLAEPSDVTEQVTSTLSAAPAEVRELVTAQLEAIVASAGGDAVVGAIIGIVLALWSASSGVGHVIEAINRAYDEKETRASSG